MSGIGGSYIRLKADMQLSSSSTTKIGSFNGMATPPLSPEVRQKLIAAAFEAREGSYSPYSKFRVGAALLGENGEIIKGANIENASYGATICAERTAMVKAASEGIRRIAAVAVVTDVPSAISPCGICRQFLREFCPLNIPVIMIPADYDAANPQGKDGKGVIEEVTFEYLLPHSFGPEDLERPRQLGGST